MSEDKARQNGFGVDSQILAPQGGFARRLAIFSYKV